VVITKSSVEKSFELNSRVGSWQNNSKELARKELGCAKKTS
jgi:hypothetical protein